MRAEGGDRAGVYTGTTAGAGVAIYPDEVHFPDAFGGFPFKGFSFFVVGDLFEHEDAIFVRLCFEAPVAFDAFVLFDFEFIVAAIAAFGFGCCGGGGIARFDFSGEGAFLQFECGHELAWHDVHGFCAANRIGGFDLNSGFCSRFSHQEDVDVFCAFFGVSDSGYKVGGACGIISGKKEPRVGDGLLPFGIGGLSGCE